ncbi:TetR/AcrR family transcriptional regulator [Actinotalea sp. M2MS4P-6]|uniref:TetR/AcrR family transcriptional regulator n=1 Tax=Actinotalea sp. M2MS4P-6 TaxID=2983762 RepID=UPI0021E3804E|nr:TetR/AcrR family transcriptional regulator [Actinotalea sp. M2MS4P-6]MCV2394233.1 TetR/AcrR family transcriptional regulator [Actinotalea sp. M2MS4P-6]
MRTADEWPPGKTRLRDTALQLFAERGPDAVSVREVAAAAGVSPGLVVHHFGTKQALREAVDDHVADLLESMLSSLDDAMQGDAQEIAAGSAGLLLEHLGPGSPVPAYLRRLLVSSEGGELFRRWYRMTLEVTERMVEAGVFRPSADPEVRAAFLLVNDLGVFLLRDQLRDALGVDPLGAQGAERWAAGVVEAYLHGVVASPPDGPSALGPGGEGEGDG